MAARTPITPGNAPAVSTRPRAQRPAVKTGHSTLPVSTAPQLTRFGEVEDLLPPPTPEERESTRKLIAQFQEMTVILRRQNLLNAVALAQQAARCEGRLVEVFAELGRRYGEDLQRPARRPALRAIEGGAA